jgi:hypothetical protein
MSDALGAASVFFSLRNLLRFGCYMVVCSNIHVKASQAEARCVGRAGLGGIQPLKRLASGIDKLLHHHQRDESTVMCGLVYTIHAAERSYLLQTSSNIKPSLDGAVGSAIDCNRLLYHRSVLCSNHSQEIHFCFLLSLAPTTLSSATSCSALLSCFVTCMSRFE